jgi:hypothetical protein
MQCIHQIHFFSQWMSFCWSTWKIVTSLFLKIPEKILTKSEKRLFLSLKDDNLPNLGSPNSQTCRWSKQNIPRIHLICSCIPVYLAGNQILHCVYTFSKVHGEDEWNWTCNLFTNLSILFHCVILTSQKYTLRFRFQSNPKGGGVM